MEQFLDLHSPNTRTAAIFFPSGLSIPETAIRQSDFWQQLQYVSSHSSIVVASIQIKVTNTLMSLKLSLWVAFDLRIIYAVCAGKENCAKLISTKISYFSYSVFSQESLAFDTIWDNTIDLTVMWH
jgi:hypothetical protein